VSPLDARYPLKYQWAAILEPVYPQPYPRSVRSADSQPTTRERTRSPADPLPIKDVYAALGRPVNTWG